MDACWFIYLILDLGFLFLIVVELVLMLDFDFRCFRANQSSSTAWLLLTKTKSLFVVTQIKVLNSISWFCDYSIYNICMACWFCADILNNPFAIVIFWGLHCSIHVIIKLIQWNTQAMMTNARVQW